jgi:membrane-associated protease RseP (regulator of RpoE activity)
VEPDEEELGEKTSVDRMRIYSVGSFANLVTGFAAASVLVLLVNSSAALLYSDGMRVVGLIDGYPAKELIQANTVIYSVNGEPTTDLPMFRNVTAKMNAGDLAVLNTSDGIVELEMAANEEDPGKAYMGVYLVNNARLGGGLGAAISYGTLQLVLEALGWIAFFNINIALVNLLPVVPFDGGRMFKELVETMRLSAQNVARVVLVSVALMAVLLIVNVMPLLKMLVDYFISLV